MLRCLVVDDSATFRHVMRAILAEAPEVQVVGEAANGEDAVRMVGELRPDVVTMDVRMPGGGGLRAVQELGAKYPGLPVLVVTVDADDNGLVFNALQAGAYDVLRKPSATGQLRLDVHANAIRLAVRSIGGVRKEPATPRSRAMIPRVSKRPVSCVGIVSSTGGPGTLQKLFAALPKNFPVPIVVVQHIAPDFCAGLVRWLGQTSSLPVKIAEQGESLVPGTIYFADRKHLVVSMGRVRSDDGPEVRGAKPSGTVLLASLAREYGPSAVGVVLTGMGDDGAAGLKLIRERGGMTLAQAESSCVIYGMPKVALESGSAELAVEAENLPSTLSTLVGLEGPETSKRQEKRKLLLVDDAETILQLERLVLGAHYELLLARNGKEAVDLAQKVRPDGILLDYAMPVMTGGEALRILKGEASTRTIPVVMVTSQKDPQLLRTCEADGAAAVVPKPIDQKLLLSTVQRLVPPHSEGEG